MATSLCDQGAALEKSLRRARLGRVLAEVYQRAAAAEPEEWPSVGEYVRRALEAEGAARQEYDCHHDACSRCRKAAAS